MAESRNTTSQLTIAEAIQIALEALQKDDLPRAEEILSAACVADPQSADALHFMGILRGQQGRAEEAIRLIRAAIAITPEYAEAHFNLGNVLRALGRRQESFDAFRRTIELAPQLPEAHLNIADLLRRAGRRADAVPFYRRALELQPMLAEAHFQLGKTLYRLGRPDEAVAVFRKWRELDPRDPVANHMVAANGGTVAPDRASDGYLRREFDDFADTFDEVMNELGYNAPEQIVAAIAACVEPREQLDILDAGCGTGRCGALAKPWARHLTGIDLSTGMIEYARRHGNYDELIVDELTHFLHTAGKLFDLIISADTFIYFGRLEAVFRGTARTLRPGGHFIFSIEHLPEGSCEQGFFLHPHGRYSQQESYVRRCLAEAQLSVVTTSQATIRMELKDPVPGMIVTARKPDANDAIG